MRFFEFKLDESSRGVLFRTPGDPFVARANPNDVLTFVQAQYFPSQEPNSQYETVEEFNDAVKQIGTQFPNTTWVNRPSSSTLAFAIITLTDTQGNEKYFGRFFSQIFANMAGKWGNDGIPGYELNIKSSKKSKSNLKPTDIFQLGKQFNSAKDVILDAKAKLEPALGSGLEMLLKKQMPVFLGEAERLPAIRDDLGETISVVALWQGMIGDEAEAARAFLLKTLPWSSCSITFPPGKNNGLVDSVLRPKKGVAIGISAKGAAGAKASASNIWAGIELLRSTDQGAVVDQFPEAVTVLQTINEESAINGPFVLGIDYNLCTQDDWTLTMEAIKNGYKQVPDNPKWKNIKKFMEHIGTQKSDAPNYNVGYHALAGLAKIISDTINTQCPNFSEACLTFLNSSPLIQIHTDAKSTPEGVQITGFRPIWPPQFKGSVRLNAGKSYYTTDAINKFAFEFKK
jgi:hypothetical protein